MQMRLHWLALIALLSGPVSSFAYVPPAHFVLDRMMKGRDGLKSLELVSEVRDLKNNAVFNETLRLDFVGGRYWAVITEPSGALAASHFAKLSELRPLGSAWIEMGYEPIEYRFREALQRFEVWPTDKIENRLVRDAGKVRWAWGKDNQIEVEKDQFVWAGFKDDDKNELQVLDQARFPRVVVIKNRGTDAYQYTLKGFKINPPVKWNTSQLVPAQGALLDPVREWMELVR